MAAEVVGNEVDPDEPLMAAGMDSLSSVEFRNRLTAECSFAKFPNTLMFDHPTLRAITNLVTSQLRPEEAVQDAPVQSAAPSANLPLATLGLYCRFPSGDGLQASWEKWLRKTDCITEIPYLRWEHSESFNPDPEAQGNFTYAKHGGFIEGAECFDTQFFGMSAAEAKTIDPQQRQMLEVSYAACHHAGKSKAKLLEGDVGVFVGQCNNDWAKFAISRQANPYTGPGTHASITSNRVSYALGIRGPSASIDTACSSSLVALDIGTEKLRIGVLKAAICAGGQLNLIAEPFVAFGKAKMLAPDGRCKTFDASADGYTRGEGCGATYLEALTNGAEDPGILPAVASTSTNQDGRSSTLTAPNGPAQQDVIKRALAQAKVPGAQLNYVECHGTGTPLGDPIEVGALKAVLGPGRASPVLLGTVKTNIGLSMISLYNSFIPLQFNGYAL